MLIKAEPSHWAFYIASLGHNYANFLRRVLAKSPTEGRVFEQFKSTLIGILKLTASEIKLLQQTTI